MVTSTFHGKMTQSTASGNGRLDAVSNALKATYGLKYTITCYQEHALNIGSNSKAIAYVGITMENGDTFWGAGVHEDIIIASIGALLTAINNSI